MDVNLSPTPVNPEHARLDRERTDRQRRLPGFNQDAVAGARVLVIGAGGLGCPVVQALAAAGVGYLHIVDSDLVELSNIQRQPLFGVPDVGEPKAEAAARRALDLCPSLTVETTIRHVDASCILDLFAASAPDCVVDCTDTFASKYLIADAAQVAGLPLVWARFCVLAVRSVFLSRMARICVIFFRQLRRRWSRVRLPGCWELQQLWWVR